MANPSRHPLYRAYRTATGALAPFSRSFLARRAERGKEDPDRIGERLGHAETPRPDGPLIWLHCASVGEANAALPLAKALIDATGARVLFTTGTVTSAQVLKGRLPPGAFHQFAPIDLPDVAHRFVDHWQPDLALFIESEIWPNLMAALARRGIPLALVNARLSERSYARWRGLPGAGGFLGSAFDLVAAQSAVDGRRFQALGCPAVVTTGNLKNDALPPSASDSAVQTAKAVVTERTIFAAASTHPGEDEPLFAAYRSLKATRPDLVLLLAPRHPDRGPALAAAAAASGLTVARRASGETPTAATDLWLFDTIGEMGVFYRLTPAVVMGGSFVPHGGQNPIEPALLDVAVLHGPHVHNFTELYGALDAAGGAVAVDSTDDIANAAAPLVDDADVRGRLTAAARTVMASRRGATERTVKAVLAIPRLAAGPLHARQG